MTDDLTFHAWADDDVAILLRDDTEEMTRYLGGPDGEAAIRARHERFLRGQRDGSVHPFRVEVAGIADPVGAVAYWRSEHRGVPAWEAAWAIGTAHQGHGYASRAVNRMLEGAIARGDDGIVWAFPRVDHAASNGVARAAGFRLHGQTDAEYPPGTPIVVNEWGYDLGSVGSAP